MIAEVAFAEYLAGRLPQEGTSERGLEFMLHLGNRLQNGLLQPKIQLTERQAQLLIFIWRYFLEHQRYPSHREITAALGSTSSNAGPWIDGLARKGVIAKVDGRRNIRITDQGVTTLIDLGVVRQEQLEL